ncbi:MAG: thiamine phosphate synthase [Akkermansia sp.]
MGSRLAPLCREYGCLFIINDYPEIALSTGADGVHLGQDDGELAPVRPCWGRTPSSGVPRTARNRLWARSGQADYIRIRPLVSHGHQAGKAGDRPGRHCRRAAAITGRVSRLLHRRH